MRGRSAAHPFSIGPAFAFSGATRPALTRVLASGGVGASFSPAGDAILYVGAGKGAHLVPGGHVGSGLIESGTFSRDGKHVALRSEEGELQVVHVASARPVRTFPRGSAPAFVGDREIVFCVDCQAMRASLMDDSQPTPLGKPACGDTLAWDPGAAWRLVVTRSSLGFGDSVGYSTISRVSVATGEWTPLFPYGAGLHYRSIRVSSDAQRVCAVQVDHVLQRIVCGTVEAPMPEVLWSDYTEEVHDLDESGTRVLFSANHRGRMHLLIGDVTTHQALIVGPDQRLDWRFLGAGASRIVGFGAKQAFVLDLEQGARFVVGSPREQWEGFARVPADSNRFVLGREQGAGRDLFWVLLPDARPARRGNAR